MGWGGVTVGEVGVGGVDLVAIRCTLHSCARHSISLRYGALFTRAPGTSSLSPADNRRDISYPCRNNVIVIALADIDYAVACTCVEREWGEEAAGVSCTGLTGLTLLCLQWILHPPSMLTVCAPGQSFTGVMHEASL